MWRFGRVIGTGGSVLASSSWNSTEPFAFAGLALNLPIGPRASIQLFGRALGGFGYSSTGLDEWNAVPPPTNLEDKFNVGFLFGAGMRVGR